MANFTSALKSCVKPIWKSKSEVKSDAIRFTENVKGLKEDQFDRKAITRNTMHNKTNVGLHATGCTVPYAGFVTVPTIAFKAANLGIKRYKIANKLRRPESKAAREMRSHISESRALKSVGRINLEAHQNINTWIVKPRYIRENARMAGKSPIFKIAFLHPDGGRKIMIARTADVHEANYFLSCANNNHFDKIPHKAWEDNTFHSVPQSEKTELKKAKTDYLDQPPAEDLPLYVANPKDDSWSNAYAGDKPHLVPNGTGNRPFESNPFGHQYAYAGQSEITQYQKS